MTSFWYVHFVDLEVCHSQQFRRTRWFRKYITLWFLCLDIQVQIYM